MNTFLWLKARKHRSQRQDLEQAVADAYAGISAAILLHGLRPDILAVSVVKPRARRSVAHAVRLPGHWDERPVKTQISVRVRLDWADIENDAALTLKIAQELGYAILDFVHLRQDWCMPLRLVDIDAVFAGERQAAAADFAQFVTAPPARWDGWASFVSQLGHEIDRIDQG